MDFSKIGGVKLFIGCLALTRSEVADLSEEYGRLISYFLMQRVLSGYTGFSDSVVYANPLKLCNALGFRYPRDWGFTVSNGTQDKKSQLIFFTVNKPINEYENDALEGCLEKPNNVEDEDIANDNKQLIAVRNILNLTSSKNQLMTFYRHKNKEKKPIDKVTNDICRNRVQDPIKKALSTNGYRVIPTKIVANGGNIIFSERLNTLFVATHPDSSNQNIVQQISELLKSTGINVQIFSVESTDPCSCVGYHLDTYLLEIDGHLFVSKEKISANSFKGLKKRFGKERVSELSLEEVQNKATQAILHFHNGKPMLIPSGLVPNSVRRVCQEKGIQVLNISAEEERLLGALDPSAGLRCRTAGHTNVAIEKPQCFI